MKDYKRLTEKIDEPNVYTVNCDKNCLKSCDIVKCRQKVLQRLGEIEDIIEAKELVYVGKWCDCTKCKNNEICYIYHQSGGGEVEKQNCSYFVAKE